MLRRHLFTASAIALALALWSAMGESAATVRHQVSPDVVVGATAAAGWASLRRWTRAIGAGELFACVRACPPDWALRKVAERATHALASTGPHASSGASLLDRVCAGAAHAARGK
jgi:hypothetical protein